MVWLGCRGCHTIRGGGLSHTLERPMGIVCAYRWIVPGKGNFTIWKLHTLDVGATPLFGSDGKGGRTHMEIWGLLTGISLMPHRVKTATIYVFQIDNICKYHASHVFTQDSIPDKANRWTKILFLEYNLSLVISFPLLLSPFPLPFPLLLCL